jgi:hypothetical protein
VQRQTIANRNGWRKRISGAREDFEQLRWTADDPTAHRAYVRRASLIESVRKRAAMAA